MPKRQIVDGYDVLVTESSEFLTETEEAILLLIDDIYFGAHKSSTKLTHEEIDALNMAVGGVPQFERPSVKPPPGNLRELAARVSDEDIRILINKLFDNFGSMRMVRLRCGQFYKGNALNQFSHLIDPKKF